MPVTGEEFLHSDYQPGAIYHMLTGWPIAYEGTIRNGPPDTITIPDELGNGARRVVTAEVLRCCPICGDEASKPALVLEGGLRLSECMTCEPPRFLWYSVA